MTIPFATMIARNLPLTLLLAFGGAVTPGLANLEFATTNVWLDAEPGVKELTATFPFTNTGDEPVTITNTRASCGCTTPELDKTTYEPGENGEIKAVFTIGGRVGPQRKTVTIETDAAGQDSITLTLETEIAQLIAVEPRLLLWRRAEDSIEPRKIRVTLGHEPMHIDEIRLMSGQGFAIDVEEVEAGKVYDVIVTPDSLEAPQRAIYQVVSDFPEEEPARYTFFAYIR